MNNKWQEQIQEISDYYKNLIRIHGSNYKSCDYGRKSSQLVKFKVLSEVMPLSNKSILDVGCGMADYATYLFSKYSHILYEGVDICEDMIIHAKIKNKNLSLKVLDILTEDMDKKYDVVTANGIFYLMNKENKYYMQALILKMYQSCSEAVAFNSLSSWADFKEDNEFYADPIVTFEYCRKITQWVTLRHDYLGHDFTIYMYKKNDRFN